MLYKTKKCLLILNVWIIKSTVQINSVIVAQSITGKTKKSKDTVTDTKFCCYMYQKEEKKNQENGTGTPP